ncbi:MAG TPA: hypothetical protein VN519_06430 [Bryobacteraceae bacterium]|nr:hypothetical protein [Bryobacteraceae bacterium]
MAKTTTEPRVRFNWGFHDATHAVMQGWHKKPGMGFLAGGALEAVTKPSEVLELHPDSEYAQGWLYGYDVAITTGERPESSEPAWQEYQTGSKWHS